MLFPFFTCLAAVVMEDGAKVLSRCPPRLAGLRAGRTGFASFAPFVVSAPPLVGKWIQGHEVNRLSYFRGNGGWRDWRGAQQDGKAALYLLPQGRGDRGTDVITSKERSTMDRTVFFPPSSILAIHPSVPISSKSNGENEATTASEARNGASEL